MAKCIKRAGIIFFVLVISCLLIVGVNTLSKANSNNGNILDLNNNLQLAADNSVILADSNVQKTKIWNDAIDYSLNNNGVNVKVILNSDWIAENSATLTTSFGEGLGFEYGALIIPKGANITLDLNNKILNRNLTTAVKNGNVIINNGSFQILDSSTEKKGTITGGNIGDFEDARPGGGIDNRGYMVMSSGRIANNRSYSIAGGVYNVGTFIMNGGEIVDNNVYGRPKGSSGGGITSAGKFIMHGGLIARNYCIYAGGGIMCASGSSSVVEIYGGEIRENNSEHGAGIRVDGSIVLAGGLITANIASICYAGVILNNGTTKKIGAGTQIFGNKNADGTESNLNLHSSSVVDIVDKLCDNNKITHIGITYEGTATSIAFTSGYSTYNSGVSPSRYFFSDISDRNISQVNGEVCYSNEARPTSKLTWNWSGSSSGSTQDSIVTIPFTGNPYTISIGGGSFYNQNGVSAKSFTISESGTYAFYANGNYLNPTFTVIVKGGKINEPTHDNNTLTYNGSRQTYNISGFNSNIMSVYNNTATNAGKYTAYIFPKEGYVWQNGTSDIILYEYEILPKQLQVPQFGNKLIVYNGAEQTYSPIGGFDSSLMKLENNQATEMGKYKAKLSLLDNKNYVWDNGSSATIEIPFEIVHPGVLLTDNSEYGYIYKDNNVRKSYSSKKYIHRVNDNDISLIEGKNRYVMGGISLNTKLSVFLSNLRNDLKLIKVYDNNNAVIYDGIASNGEITDSAGKQILGTGYKVELFENSTSATAFDTVYLSVLGDINGDGRISASDIAYIREIAKDNSILNTMALENVLAAMINNKGGVTSVDSEILHNVISGNIDITTFFSTAKNETTNYTYLTLNKENEKYNRVVSETATNVIGNISVNTKVSEFKAKLATLGVNTAQITIYNNRETQITDDNAVVGTGWYYEINGSGRTYISVLGDLNGDGRLSASDMMYLRELINGDKDSLKDYQILSALILNTGGITSADSAVLMDILEKSSNLNNY